MSYILDALKKSEAERTRGAVPTLLTPPHTQFRRKVASWILLGALAINAALLAAWMYWPAATIDTAPATAAPLSTSAPVKASPDASRATVVPEEQSEQNSGTRAMSEHPPPPEVAPTAPITAIDSVAATASPDSASPDISFSTHVYASDPSMRAVTMDGKRFVEGDTIRPGVRIEEITETGVVLNVSGRSMPVEVLQDWH
jgi:general secretion pathway protein B